MDAAWCSRRSSPAQTHSVLAGVLVFFDDYSDGIADRLWRQCPSGNISGLMAIRETNDYGPVSGEVVRLVGYCHQRKDRRQ